MSAARWLLPPAAGSALWVFLWCAGAGACCDGEDTTDATLVQRLFVGIESCEIGSTYGQYWTGMGLHDGVDFVVPANTKVKALEAGEVVELRGEGYEGVVVIQSAAMHDGQPTYLQYGHVTQCPAYVGVKVAVGDVIGYVAATEAMSAGESVYAHLHLEWDRQTSARTISRDFKERERACGNPFDHPEVGLPVDDEGPQLVPFESGSPSSLQPAPDYVVEVYAAASDDGPYTEVSPEELPASGFLQVVVRAEDRTESGSGRALAPRTVQLLCRTRDLEGALGEPVELGGIEFSMPIWDDADLSAIADSVYCLKDGPKSHGSYEQREFYFVATRSPNMAVSLNDAEQKWLTQSSGVWELGEDAARGYQLEVVVRDHAGHERRELIDLAVKP